MSQHKPEYSIPVEGPRDPILVDLLPDFLDAWEHDLSTGWAQIRTREDLVELKRFGHTIKGSFIQFGFRDLAQAGREIMNGAENNNWLGADEHVKALQLVVNTMKQNLTSLLGRWKEQQT